MPHRVPFRFRKSLLAVAASAVLAPHTAQALDLAQSPPGTVEPYVTPNVIISIDDSGSMNFRLDQENATGATNNTVPTGAGGTWLWTDRRINVLKHALNQVFQDTTLLPERKIRLAWQALNANNRTPGNVNTGDTTAAVSTNSMKALDSTHRSAFMNFVGRLSPSGSTPSHRMFQQADAYMRLGLSPEGPWATEPGTTGAPYLACRRNYHIMMTDGRWNGTATSVPNTAWRDNATNLTLDDGTVYGGSTSAARTKTALYRDTSTGTTLADWAFYSWARPLQTTGLEGSMQPAADYRKAPATETFTNAAGSSVTLDRYWNPRYNPATWPHMVTYTIGFSSAAFTWNWSAITPPTEMVPFGYDGSFPDLASGAVTWPNLTSSTEARNALDLWHAALNGRGRFYAVDKGEHLEKAFREIFQQINTETQPNLSSTAASGANISRSEVGKYTAAYEPQNAWKGFVVAESVQRDGSTVSHPGWGGKNTADKLDGTGFSVSSRLIYSWSDLMDADGEDKGGVPFRWASDESNLSAAQKLWLQKNQSGTDEGAAQGQNRLNYVRGERSLEGSEESGYTTAKPFRERKSRQGDIVNSVVWYLGAPVSNYPLKGYAAFTRANKNRPGMIYVGGNDGMLHGFSAADGTEKIAYVPKGVIPTLSRLTAPAYNNSHLSFVDGSPMTGDVDLGTGVQAPDDPSYDASAYTPDWRTLLVGTLGAGGKGYFVLDVTNPTDSANPEGIPGFTEGGANQLVRLDRTRGAGEPDPDCDTGLNSAQQSACNLAKEQDADIGHITAQPVLDDNNSMRTTQITRMNNNRWAVVMGNGYNSKNQRPVLLIQYLDGAQELIRLAATNDPAGTGVATDNGLAAPRLVDLNGDGRPDVAYAGDNLGNLWKFDLTSDTATEWKVAFGGAPLFTAKGPASLGSTLRQKTQPISAPPTVRANDRTKTVGSGPTAKTVPVGGMMVAFGTGRNVALRDAESVDVQTLYSVIDNTRYRVRTTGSGVKRLEVHPGGGSCPNGANCVPAPQPLGEGVTNAKLAQQRITELGGGAAGTVDTVNDLNQNTWANFNGWYMDLPAVGERLLKPMEFYDGSNILAVYSQVPAKGSDVDPNVESCESTSVDEERQFRTLINVMDGKSPTVQLVDYNGDGSFNMASDSRVSRVKVSKGSHTLITQGNNILDLDTKNVKELLARMPEQSLRPSWRMVR